MPSDTLLFECQANDWDTTSIIIDLIFVYTLFGPLLFDPLLFGPLLSGPVLFGPLLFPALLLFYFSVLSACTNAESSTVLCLEFTDLLVVWSSDMSSSRVCQWEAFKLLKRGST